MIIKVLTPAFDIADTPGTVQDSNLVSLVNTNNASTQIAVGAGVVWVGAGERVVIEKVTGDIISAPDATSGVWASGVAYRA